MRQCRVGDPLKIPNALRGRQGVSAGILLLTLEHDSLRTDIGDVRDQHEADRREQERPTHEVAGLGRRLANCDRGECGSEEGRQQWKGAARRLDRTGSHPDQHEDLIGQDGLRQELHQHELGDAERTQPRA